MLARIYIAGSAMIMRIDQSRELLKPWLKLMAILVFVANTSIFLSAAEDTL